MISISEINTLHSLNLQQGRINKNNREVLDNYIKMFIGAGNSC